jgi:hypothetical protein
VLIEVLVRNPGETYPLYRLADVEAPDPCVIGQLGDIRVVASYAAYANYREYEIDPPRFDTMVADLIVEQRVGTDALGVEAWKRLPSNESPATVALSAVARLLFARTNPIPPSQFHVIEREPVSEGAR